MHSAPITWFVCRSLGRSVARALVERGERAEHGVGRAPAREIGCIMVDLAPRIAADPAVCHGKPVIKGTRVMVATVVGHVGAGDPIDEVARDYGVTREDVLASIAYAADVVAGEEFRAL